jgi:recombination protein RecA
MAPPRKTKTAKKATKKATKKASPKRKSTSSPAKRATQLQVLTQVHQYFADHKKFKGQLIRMDELDNTVPGYVSTQSLALDWIAGNGGLPMSRVVDISGDEGTGKSTFGDHIMSEVQRIGGHAYLWDPENARDNRYQKQLGIARARAGQITSHTMEDGFELMIELLEQYLINDPERPGIILWDTPAGTPTRKEADADEKDERFGPAKIIRGYLRKLNQLLMQTKWILCVINQTYRGTMQSGQTYKAVYGGGGVPFYSSCRLEISHVSRFWRSDTDKTRGMPPMGQTAWVRNIKNRCGMPWRSRQICVEFGQGIDNYWTVFDTLKGFGGIEVSGGWCAFDPSCFPELAKAVPKKWQGSHHGLKLFVAENPDVWPMLIDAYRSVEESWGG